MNSVRTKTWIGAVALVLGSVGACNGHVATGGSETNWLGDCSSNDDCSVGQCLCGVCSQQCDRDDPCPEGLDTCAGRGSVAFGRFCGGGLPGMPGLCAKGCGDGVPCTRGFLCETGVCVPALKGGGGADGGTGLLGEGGPTGQGGSSSGGQPMPQGGSGPLATSTTSTNFVEPINFAGVDPSALYGKCLPARLQVGADGSAPCSVIAAMNPDGGCNCDGSGLTAASAGTVAAVRGRMQQTGACGADGKPACDQVCACELPQASGTELANCRSASLVTSDTPEWCYVDPDAGLGDPSLVAQCPATQRRMLRLLGVTAGESLYIACSARTENTAASAVTTPGNLGDPCITQDEANPLFFGFAETEVNVESQSPSCSTGICLVANFRGRVSCTYGQTDNGMVNPNTGLPEVDPTKQRCITAGPNPVPVEVPVRPQLMARPPEKSVYCSCRCDGPAGSGPFCACPSGFECAPLVDDYGTSGGSQLAGSYCIKAGTGVPDPTKIPQTECGVTGMVPRPNGCGLL